MSLYAIMSQISANYVYCATEGGDCPITGNQSVAFTNTNQNTDRTIFRNYSAARNPVVKCTWEGLGADKDASKDDGTTRYCLVVDRPNITFDAIGLPNDYTMCPTATGTTTSEDTICKPPLAAGQTADFLYGAGEPNETGDTFTYAQTPQTKCSYTIFGDSDLGVQKNCYWRATPETGTRFDPKSLAPAAVSDNKKRSLSIGWIIAIIIGIIIFVLIIALIIRRVSRK